MNNFFTIKVIRKNFPIIIQIILNIFFISIFTTQLKSVYILGLSAVCLCLNLSKYIWIIIKVLQFINICCRRFNIENKMCSLVHKDTHTHTHIKGYIMVSEKNRLLCILMMLEYIKQINFYASLRQTKTCFSSNIGEVGFIIPSEGTTK